MDPAGSYRSGFSRRERRRLRHSVNVYVNGVLFTTIPAGFESDGMSFPWWQATWDDPWHYRYIAAALLHDWLLDQGELPKCQIDWLFQGVLLCYEVPALEVAVFWLSVRSRRPRRDPAVKVGVGLA